MRKQLCAAIRKLVAALFYSPQRKRRKPDIVWTHDIVRALCRDKTGDPIVLTVKGTDGRERRVRFERRMRASRKSGKR